MSIRWHCVSLLLERRVRARNIHENSNRLQKKLIWSAVASAARHAFELCKTPSKFKAPPLSAHSKFAANRSDASFFSNLPGCSRFQMGCVLKASSQSSGVYNGCGKKPHRGLPGLPRLWLEARISGNVAQFLHFLSVFEACC